MRQFKDVQVQQDAIRYARRANVQANTVPFIARVKKVYSERMTCDLSISDGQTLKDVPVMTHSGMIKDAPYGSVSLPAVDDYVVVMHVFYGALQHIIVGTTMPYQSQEFSKPPVKSEKKASAKKILEKEKPLEDRYITKSGTSVVVEEDGSLDIEAPSGRRIRLDEEADEIKVSDAHKNTFIMDSDGVSITDKNGNTLKMESGNKISINGGSKSLVTHPDLTSKLVTFVNDVNAELVKIMLIITDAVDKNKGLVTAKYVMKSLTLDISSAEAKKVKTS